MELGLTSDQRKRVDDLSRRDTARLETHFNNFDLKEESVTRIVNQVFGEKKRSEKQTSKAVEAIISYQECNQI